MKGKSELSHDAPEKLEDALNEIEDEVMQKVLVRHLKVDPKEFEWGDHFFQLCDFSKRPKSVPPTNHICIVTLTFVSGPTANGNRGWEDFPRAREAMIPLWVEKLKWFMPRGHQTRLSLIIALDEPITQVSSAGLHFRSNLVEGPHIWVPGEADLATCPIYVGKRSKR